MFQQTLKDQIRASGIGLHTGHSSEICILPAAPHYGIVFRRLDLPTMVDIPARWEYVVDTLRGTTVGKGGATVQTVEHLLAALWGMGIDNARVDVVGPEVPVLDGSARGWVNRIHTVGIRSQKVPRQIWKIDRAITLSAGESRISIFPSSEFRIFYLLSYADSFIGAQPYFFWSRNGQFEQAVAPARTFGFLREVRSLHQKGLARGGSLKNALVIGNGKYLNPPRFSNELVRHKVLDLVGDLALFGKRVEASIVAIKSGHPLHLQMLRQLAKIIPREGISS